MKKGTQVRHTSMFTQMHFNAIARIMATVPNDPTKLDIIDKLTISFGQDNHRFNVNKFKSACGIAVPETEPLPQTLTP